MSYYDDEDDLSTLMIMLMFEILSTMMCCLLCPGEGLVFIGIMKIFLGLATGASTGDTSFFASAAGGLIWIRVGQDRMARRQEANAYDDDDQECLQDRIARERDYRYRKVAQEGKTGDTAASKVQYDIEDGRFIRRGEDVTTALKSQERDTEMVAMKNNSRQGEDEDGPFFLMHQVAPSDTFVDVCLKYRLTPTELRKANNGFSGTNLKKVPDPLKIPVSKEEYVAYHANNQTKKTTLDDVAIDNKMKGENESRNSDFDRSMVPVTL